MQASRVLKQATQPEMWLLVLASLLFAVWPVPHTNSLRELLMVASIALAARLCYRHRRVIGIDWWPAMRWPVCLLGALTAWIVVVAVFISPETYWSLDEIRGQWLKPVFALLLGGLLVFVLSTGAIRPGQLWLALVAALLFHVIAVNIDAVVHLAQGVTSYRAMGLTAGPDKANYLSNILLAVLLAEVLARLQHRSRLLPTSWATVAVAVVLTVSSFVVEGMRSGVVAAAAMFVIAAAIYLRHAVRRRGARSSWRVAVVLSVTAAVVVGLVASVGSIKPGSSWKNILSAVPLALDTERHKAWLDSRQHEVPTLPGGEMVDPSVFVRIAWIKEGLIASAENPLGIGYGRNAFGHAIEAKYGTRIGHSHSSIIDLVIGIGIPGLLLWLAFVASLLWLSARHFASGWGYALLLLVVDFATRMAIDSNLRDHMFQMFMFLVGVTGTLAVMSSSGGAWRRR